MVQEVHQFDESLLLTHVGMKAFIHSLIYSFTHLFELEDDEHVRAAAVGVHVSGCCGSGSGSLFHQLLHLHRTSL